MISDRTLSNLRTSAALALLVPGVSVEVAVGEQVVVEASRPPFVDASHPVLPVCAFHRSVARAHELRRSGSRVEMVGLAGDLEPDVGLRCASGLEVVPGGVVRRAGDTWLHFCSLSIGVDRVEPAAAEVFEETGSTLDIHLHADRSLDVTVVVADTPARDKTAARAAIDLVEAIAARATIDSLVDWIAPSPLDWDALLARP